MKIGTIETDVVEKKKRKVRSTLTGGSGSNGGNRNRGGGGGGGNDGGDNKDPRQDFQENARPYYAGKIQVGMWFLLLVVMMTFGGLISAYVVISTNAELEWKPFALPVQVWISTVLILLSSATYKIAESTLKAENQQKAKNWLLATTVLGAMFIASQILAWFQLVQKGIYVQNNQYAGFFYILTAIHAIHVVGGIIALGYIVIRTWNITFSSEELGKRKLISTTVGWYWHLMDGLWIVLFLLLGFWR